MTVWPSGAARATRPVPMVPAAPVGFSTMTDWPSDPFIRSASTRASASVGPPAGKGTTMVTGRIGLRLRVLDEGEPCGDCDCSQEPAHLIPPAATEAATRVLRRRRTRVHVAWQTPRLLPGRRYSSDPGVFL